MAKHKAFKIEVVYDDKRKHYTTNLSSNKGFSTSEFLEILDALCQSVVKSNSQTMGEYYDKVMNTSGKEVANG